MLAWDIAYTFLANLPILYLMKTPVYLAQSTITCLKLTTKTLEQDMKYVQS